MKLSSPSTDELALAILCPLFSLWEHMVANFPTVFWLFFSKLVSNQRSCSWQLLLAVIIANFSSGSIEWKGKERERIGMQRKGKEKGKAKEMERRMTGTGKGEGLNGERKICTGKGSGKGRDRESERNQNGKRNGNAKGRETPSLESVEGSWQKCETLLPTSPMRRQGLEFREIICKFRGKVRHITTKHGATRWSSNWS